MFGNTQHKIIDAINEIKVSKQEANGLINPLNSEEFKEIREATVELCNSNIEELSNSLNKYNSKLKNTRIKNTELEELHKTKQLPFEANGFVRSYKPGLFQQFILNDLKLPTLHDIYFDSNQLLLRQYKLLVNPNLTNEFKKFATKKFLKRFLKILKDSDTGLYNYYKEQKLFFHDLTYVEQCINIHLMLREVGKVNDNNLPLYLLPPSIESSFIINSLNVSTNLKLVLIRMET